MSINTPKQLCQATLTKYEPEWGDFLHDITTELALAPSAIKLSTPNHLIPYIAFSLSTTLKAPVLYINTSTHGFALLDGQLSEQERDTTVVTDFSKTMHALFSNTSVVIQIQEHQLNAITPSITEYQRSIIHITLGQRYALSELTKSLVKSGYVRHLRTTADYGFVVHGDEIEINHPLFESPLRISFFGNVIEKIISTTNNRKQSEQSYAIPPLAFPSKSLPLRDCLKTHIIITEHELSHFNGIQITTNNTTPDIALPERLQELPELPHIQPEKKQSKTYSSPISKERALELIGNLTPGKPAVHTDHGIGIFEGLEQRTLDGEGQEYIVLRYADGDTLSVPVAFAHKVSPYIGESSPALYRLGGAQWQKNKKKARHDAALFAQELIAINKKRQLAIRDPYTIDTTIEEQLSSSFPYTLTPDQITTWSDIQTDMQKEIPMDRLMVGDVGFGKTELAMRCARHAFANGKQIAVLAPTTLLVQQHADTFRERLSDISSSLFLLSRFSSLQEIQKAKKAIANGMPVIIIGTHAVLSTKLEWKKLSLLIIDEEQRFGVGQKEHLKKMRSTIDVLSLSATPIPRTLSMALSGLRSLSVIATAPMGRKNIETSIKKVSDTALQQALLPELARDGQIYIVAPRIQLLGMIKEHVQALVPSARIAIAHARLPDETLSQIIHAFDTHEIDILISSSIVENGLDLPNANTMVVWNAPHFGLAQLYQLRGRIGRRSRQGHALFLYSQDKLTTIQRERLTALTEATRVGSGWEIARRDLEIRGAGNILGAEQSGSASTVGMYLYLDMVDGVEQEQKADIHTILPAYIPAQYISNTDDRTAWYIRISRARSQDQLNDYMNALTETYGPLPAEIKNLSRLIILQQHATQNGITALQTKTITPNDEDPYVRLLITSKKPVELLQKLSNIKNKDKSPARWQVKDYTLSWDTDAITPELVDQIIYVLQ